MNLHPRAATYLLVVVIGGIACLLGVKAYYRKSNENKLIESLKKFPGVSQDSAQSLTWWSTRIYSPVTNENISYTASAVKVVTRHESVTHAMESSGRESLKDFLTAYSTGSYSDLIKWLSPNAAPPKWQPQIFEYRKSILQKQKSSVETQDPADPERVMQTFWERGDGKNTTGSPRFQNLIKGVSLQDSSINFFSENRYPEEMEIAVRSTLGRHSAGRSVYKRSTEISPTPNSIINSTGSVVLMEINLVLAFKAPDYPHPLSLWYYWDPQSTKWLPCALVELSYFKRQITLFF